MKIKLTSLIEALESLKNDYSTYYGETYRDCMLEVSLIEEKIEEGQLANCLSFVTNESIRETVGLKSSVVTRCLEIYENYPTRLIKTDVIKISHD